MARTPMRVVSREPEIVPKVTSEVTPEPETETIKIKLPEAPVVEAKQRKLSARTLAEIERGRAALSKLRPARSE